jgi:hypothetical protein
LVVRRCGGGAASVTGNRQDRRGGSPVKEERQSKGSWMRQWQAARSGS